MSAVEAAAKLRQVASLKQHATVPADRRERVGAAAEVPGKAAAAGAAVHYLAGNWQEADPLTRKLASDLHKHLVGATGIEPATAGL
jgi:hypothetical protein